MEAVQTEKYLDWLLYHRWYSRLREIAPGEQTESKIKVRERKKRRAISLVLGSSPRNAPAVQ
jgi:hypothetical protein